MYWKVQCSGIGPITRITDVPGEPKGARLASYIGESGTTQYRRVVLDGYLDRRETERIGCEAREETCDVCRGEDEAEEDKEKGKGASDPEVSDPEPRNPEAIAVDESEAEDERRTFEQ
jgi:hypothetical protein